MIRDGDAAGDDPVPAWRGADGRLHARPSCDPQAGAVMVTLARWLRFEEWCRGCGGLGGTRYGAGAHLCAQAHGVLDLLAQHERSGAVPYWRQAWTTVRFLQRRATFGDEGANQAIRDVLARVDARAGVMIARWRRQLDVDAITRDVLYPYDYLDRGAADEERPGPWFADGLSRRLPHHPTVLVLMSARGGVPVFSENHSEAACLGWVAGETISEHVLALHQPAPVAAALARMVPLPALLSVCADDETDRQVLETAAALWDDGNCFRHADDALDAARRL